MQATSRDQGARESCEDQHCFNFPLLPQGMDVIIGLTTTDSLSLRLRKLVYYR